MKRSISRAEKAKASPGAPRASVAREGKMIMRRKAKEEPKASIRRRKEERVIPVKRKPRTVAMRC